VVILERPSGVSVVVLVLAVAVCHGAAPSGQSLVCRYYTFFRSLYHLVA